MPDIDPAAAGRDQERALLGLFNQLWNDPEQGEVVRRRAKALNPDIAIPDDNPVAVAVRGELKETREKVSALERILEETRAATAQKEAETELRGKIGKAQDKYKLTDEGLQGTIKLMQERQISDPEAAAALYLDNLPKVAPQSASPVMPSSKFNLFGTGAKDDVWEKAHTDQDGFFADVVNQVFTEMPVGG